jgi:hypothetical protein
VAILDSGEVRRPSPNLSGGFGEILSAISLAGLILYGVALLGYRAFYGGLGIEPEEAGLGYPQILAQAAFGAAFFLAVLLGDMFFEGRLVEYFTQDRLHRLTSLWSVVSIVFLSLISNGGYRITIIVVVASLAITAPILFLHSRTPKQPHAASAGRILVFYLIMLIIIPLLVGRQLASDYISGEEETPLAIVGLLRVNVKSVAVSWIGDDPPWIPTPEASFLYLGQSNGMAALFDTRTSETYRVPIESIAISDRLR